LGETKKLEFLHNFIFNALQKYIDTYTFILNTHNL
jgi:hypothetical protein